ncbi:ArsR/SmtB family transcription factor [Luteolibacter marinus]|uniref:ArsR/SmtB family transcription factor n=1 Tax=Luteolibacter marinus TaxID=2776705 RepID=UPI0018680185|nr:metalloregulator ArsR/SmtB family transcription factor [Luteolibacter marinus]
MSNVVAFARALADETRWRIVRLVMDEALCVCELADILEMPQSTVSSHVQVIRKAGLLESEKQEKWTYFRIARPQLRLLRSIASAFGDGSPAADVEKMTRRLAEREDSCCPAPKKLKRPRRTNATP